MAWTYFTSPLAAGALITTAQRNELLDVFCERANAVAPKTGYTWEVTSALRNDGFAHDLVMRYHSSGGVTISTPTRIMAGLDSIIGHFGVPAIVEAASFDGALDAIVWDWESILADAGVSLTYAQLTSDPLVEMLDRWNAAKAVLERLTYPALAVSAVTYHHRSATHDLADDPGEEDAAWADVKTAFLAATDATTAFDIPPMSYFASYWPEGGGRRYSLSGKRQTLTLTVPAMPCFEASTGILAAVQNDADQPMTAEWDGNATGITPGVVYSTMKFSAIAGAGSTGSLDLALYFDAYFDDAAIDPYRPSYESEIEHVGGNYGTPIFAQVTWENG